MSDSDQVVVIGGGVIGSACAYRIRQTGAATLLLDPGGRRPASFGNAGHIAIEQTRPLASPEALKSAPRRLFAVGGALDFRLADIATWAPWAIRFLAASTAAQAERGSQALSALLAQAMPAWRRLAGDLGERDHLVEKGHLIVWETPQSAKTGLQHWIDADTGQAHVRALTPGERDQIAAALGRPLAGAALVENTGQVSDPNLIMRDLRAAFEALGGEWRSAGVARLAREGRRTRVELQTGQTITPDRVVVAAGVGSKPLLESLGFTAPVIAERGYHVEGPLTGGGRNWNDSVPVVFEDRSMIATGFADRLRASSFVEFGREGSPPDPRKFAHLKRNVRELGLPIGEPISEWMGARPTLPDYLPAIGMAEGGVIYAFGHQHLGLTLSALTGEIVRDLVSDRTPSVGLESFDLNRFAPRATQRVRQEA